MTSVSRRYGHQGAPFERASGEGSAAHGAPVVLMVSGGADSSALLLLAATSSLNIEDGRGEARIGRERLHVLHVNHRARPLDAQEDEEFVRELAGRFGVPVTVVSVDVPALTRASHGRSFEDVARDVRYEAAADLADELSERSGTRPGDARILTAHTADDRVETFFMNALRGSGPAGLSSIPRRRNRIVRPLLDRTHEELCELLRMRGIIWREDSTNADERFLRNYVRREIVPPAKARNPRLVEALSSTCDLLGDEDAYLTGIAAEALRRLTVEEGDGYRLLDLRALALEDVAVARRVVRRAILSCEPSARLEARHVNSALTLVAEGSGSMTAPLGVDVAADRGVLVIRARRAQTRLASGWLSVPGRLTLGSLLPEALDFSEVELVEDGDRADRVGGGPRRLTLGARFRRTAALGDLVATARTFGLEHEGAAVLLDAEACGLSSHDAASRLWVGPPEPGEVLFPLGMNGRSKRLSDLLSEVGVPARERPLVPVVRRAPKGEIVWVAGIRADERARVTSTTKTLVVLTLE